jgi:histidinol-phosphate aminotransferase
MMIKPKSNLENLQRVSSHEPSRLFKHRLDRNERNQPFSLKFIESIKAKMSGELFMVYPELDGIYQKIAEWLQLDTDHIMLHSGSEQTIKAVFETYINAGDRILLHFPGFVMYNVYCNMFQAQVVEQYFDVDLHFDWQAYADKINDDIRLVVLENPNGFVGIAPSVADMRLVVEKAAQVGAIVLVDEAYYHFHDITAAAWIEEFDNLIITRTFSKAFGLAGLRAGYLLSNPTNIANLKKVRPAYEINSVTALVVAELLDNLEEVSTYIEDTRKNLFALRRELAGLGVTSSDSRANFIAVRLGEAENHEKLRAALAIQDILIRRPFREPFLQEWVRISTAPPDIQAILLQEIRRILAGSPGR